MHSLLSFPETLQLSFANWLSRRSSPATQISLAGNQLPQRREKRIVDPAGYPDDPEGYARDVLGVPYIWQKQIEVANALRKPPYRVLLRSGHKLGKTWTLAWLVNWWFDSFNPSGVITIAPRKEHLTSILWKDIRLLRQSARCNLMGEMMPKSPEMGDGVAHYARGITATKGEAVTGRHEKKTLFMIDEAVGVDSIYFTTIKGMFKPDGSCGWICCCNPTDTTSQVYQEEQTGDWTVISLSCLDHPNVIAGLNGDPLKVERAVTKEMIDNWVHSDWCNPVHVDDRLITDFPWPPLKEGATPESTKWWRPGPEMEGRCLGIWPSQGTYGIWSEALWKACLIFDEDRHTCPLAELPEIGCDVARYGDDNTEMHTRWGALSLDHEAHNGWSIPQTTGRLIEMARDLSAMVNDLRKPRTMQPCLPEDIPIKVDDDGLGGAVTDLLAEQGFNVQGVSAQSRAADETRYPNKRSELWFRSAALARAGLLCLSRLESKTVQRIKAQAMAPTWKLDAAGRRVVEPKDITKKNIGHSPDAMDALNLAYYETSVFEPGPVIEPRQRPTVMTEQWRKQRRPGRGIFG